MSSVVEIGFEFLSQLAGDHVLGAEVDNLAQVVRLRIRGPHTQNPDPVGVAPSVSQRWLEMPGPFIVITGPGGLHSAPLLAFKRDVRSES